LDLDGHLLQLLLAVVEAGSVTGAAQRLGVTQSAVSHLLDKLRTITGDPLFVKSGRGIVATARAEELAAQARGIIARLHVKAADEHAAARSLSGGNLQKFIMGREIDAGPRLLIVSQPTWGVDVGAAAQIRAEILALRDAGCAVLVVSEELEELFELSDRLHVMAKGRLSPSLPMAEATTERIGEWMSGLWHGEVQHHLQEMEAGHAAA